MGKNTYLLNTTGDQSSVFIPDSLRHQTSAFARPRRLHLAEHPFVRFDFPWPVEVDDMIETDHHANLRSFRCLLCVFRTLLLLLLSSDCGGRECPVVKDVAATSKTVRPSNSADKPAIRHVGKGRQVRLIAASRRYRPSALDP